MEYLEGVKEGTYGIIEEDGTERLFSYYLNDGWFYYDKTEKRTIKETETHYDYGVVVPNGTISMLLKKEVKKEDTPIYICKNK